MGERVMMSADLRYVTFVRQSTGPGRYDFVQGILNFNEIVTVEDESFRPPPDYKPVVLVTLKDGTAHKIIGTTKQLLYSQVVKGEEK